MPTTTEYMTAQTDHSKRESFVKQLKQLFPEISKHGGAELIYDPTGQKYHALSMKMYKDGIMTTKDLDTLPIDMADSANFTVLGAASQMGKGRKWPIFVTKNSFEKYSLDEFLNVLLDHETIHTRDLMDGIKIKDFLLDYQIIKKIRPGTLWAITEVRADKNMIDKSYEKQIRSDLRIKGICRMQRHIQKLKDISNYPYNTFEKNLTLAFLDEFYKT